MDMHAGTVADATLEVVITRGPNHARPGSVESLGIVARMQPSIVQRAAYRVLKFLQERC